MGRQRERDNIRQLVSSYLDGELPPEDAAWVGRQISDDPRYAEVYRAYRAIRMDMRAMPVPEVPPAVSAAIRAYTATAAPYRPVISLRARIARLTTAAVTIAAALVAIFTHGFGMPMQFAHGVNTAVRTPVSVNVSTGPTVATLSNTKLAYNESAELHFSSAMDETTVKQAVHFAPLSTPNTWLSPAQLAYSPGTTTLSTIPMALHSNTDYRVTIPKGLRDLYGNEVQNTSFDFSVGAAPPLPPIVANLPTVLPTPTPASTDAAVSAIVPIATAASQTATPEPVTAPTATVPADEGPDATATTARPIVKPTVIVARPATLAPSVPTAVATAVPMVAATATTGASAPTTVVTTSTTGTTTSGSASATAIAKPTTPATIAPMPTPEPVAATATTAPAPTATTAIMTVPVAPSFQSAYAQNANRLGGPTGVASTFSGTQLNFTNGVMVYVPGRSFYVIYAGGSWSTASNPGGSGAAVPNATGGYVPGGAYGAAWTNAKLSGRLGYATTTQESPYAGSSQSFDNGVILKVGGDVYVLFNNGAYQLFGA